MKILTDKTLDFAALEKLRALSNIKIENFEAIDEPRLLAPEFLRDVEVLFCDAPPTNLDDAKNLRFLQIGSVGYSQLYELDLPARKIRASNARGVFDIPIAEWNIAMMIYLLRDMKSIFANQERGVWDRNARFQQELRGRTLGIWGYGGIGRETARLAKCLGLQIHVQTRDGAKPRGCEYSQPGTGDAAGVLPDRVFVAGQEAEFLSALDFLVLSMPLTPQNEGIIGERELRALKPSAYLLNPARGPLVEEDALLKALRENWIAGAALDTHYAYPLPPEHPLWKFPRVILTPHISGSDQSTHYQRRIGEIFVENVRRLQSDEPLLNELTTQQLQGN